MDPDHRPVGWLLALKKKTPYAQTDGRFSQPEKDRIVQVQRLISLTIYFFFRKRNSLSMKIASRTQGRSTEAPGAGRVQDHLVDLHTYLRRKFSPFCFFYQMMKHT